MSETWAIDRSRPDVTSLGVVVDVKKGYTHMCTLPAGTKITQHPSGNGVLAAHPDHPPKWIKLDGTVEEIRATSALPADSYPRPCTCHPDDNPPKPCPGKGALTDCRDAADSPSPPCTGAELQALWYETAADAMVELINRTPRSPTKAEIIATLKGVV